MTPVRGKGLHPSPAHKKARFGASHPALAAPSFPSAAALRPFVPFVWDQDGSSTCFAHAPATLIYLAQAVDAADGLLDITQSPIVLPSPLGIARITYANEQPGSQPLEDVGASIADVMTAIGRVGVHSIGAMAEDGRFSDVTSDRVRLRPTLGEDLASARHVVLGPEHLHAGANDFEAQLAASIGFYRRGVVSGIHATPAFDAWSAGDPPLDDASGITDEDGHAVAALDYRTEPDGSLSFWLLSSWTKSFGEDGGAWVRGRCLRQLCFEAWRMQIRMLSSAGAGR